MSLEQDIRNLSKVPLFAVLEPEARRLLAFSGETRILRAGELLFQRGESSDGGFVLLSGSISLIEDAGETTKTHVVSPFALIGELALISKTERPVTAVSRDNSTVLKISRALFHRVLKEYPQSALRLRNVVRKRLHDYSTQLEAARFQNFDES